MWGSAGLLRTRRTRTKFSRFNYFAERNDTYVLTIHLCNAISWPTKGEVKILKSVRRHQRKWFMKFAYFRESGRAEFPSVSRGARCSTTDAKKRKKYICRVQSRSTFLPSKPARPFIVRVLFLRRLRTDASFPLVFEDICRNVAPVCTVDPLKVVGSYQQCK